jgi:hypothetical protein
MSEGIRAKLDDGRPVIVQNGQEKPLNSKTISEVSNELDHLVPKPLGLDPSFGFGDRLGVGTPGHAEALMSAGGAIQPIFAQQSIREMTRTDRTPDEVMSEAQFGMLLAGYEGRTGADADHLKTEEDVDRTAEAGFNFFTIDPSDHVDEQADQYDADTLDEKFSDVRAEVDWYGSYQGNSIQLENGTVIEFSETACRRCAVKYGRALNEAIELANYIDEKHEDLDRPYEIELSVDETEEPTTLVEHYIVADQMLKAGVELVSLAPRYIGEFEKGVDFKGDPEALEQSLEDHASIARTLGPYKLSLHSGSDKQSMYPAFSKATRGRFHVKTAGTSYLEALRVVAKHAPDLFREMVDYSRGRYLEDKKTYHVSATLDGVPAPEEISDDLELERIYLERWEDVNEQRGFTNPGRQILHCTYGSVLTHEEYGETLQDVLRTHLDTYTSVLKRHFEKHLEPLQAGL